MTNQHFLQKGDRVSAEWFETKIVSLAGEQLKFGANRRSVIGIVTHIRGDDPIRPTTIGVWIQPEEGGEEVVIEPGWIKEIFVEKD